ncbi:MAG TPA: FtsX-like permease family protein [Micromonosporaceae bacterium]|nr:FtsX-like permease family protein [Micromonosporaceae bacterium]
MTAAVLDRPAATRDGGAPARRAVVRWAWRLFRREWRQQLLVLALIIVAVAATILGAAIASNTPPPANVGFGTANHLVTIPGSDTHLAADIAAIQNHFGAADVIENANLATGLAQGAQLRAQDTHGAYGGPMLALASGRYPSGASEVAMTAQLASTFGVHVGGLWSNAGRELRIVGLVENPQNLLDNFALVAPGQVSTPNRVTVLFDATAASLAGFRFPAGTAPVTPVSSSGIDPAVIVFAIAIIGLIFVGLVAVAGFTVLAQRRLRALGMLSALGATDRNVRLVMVTNGALVGVLGALIGAVIGLGSWIAYAPYLASRADHRVTWTNLPWWLVGSAIVLAVLTATIASRRPARIVARVPVVAALSGRPPTAKAVHRSAVPGAVVLTVATLMLAFSGGWGGNSGKDTGFQLLGLIATAVGLLLLAPLAISLLGVVAGRAPVAIRIALRDLARYRSRSGAALAATSFAILIAMLITLITTGRYADPVDYFGPNLPANQVLVAAAGNDTAGPKGNPVQSPTQTPAEQQAQAAAIAASLNSHDVLALDSTDAFLGRHTATGTMGGPGIIYVATPAVLTHYGIDPASVDPATLLVTSRSGLQGMGGLQLVGGSGPDSQALNDPRIQAFAKLPTDASAPNLLATERAVAALKIHVTPNAAWLIQAPQALTSIQINTARQLAVAAGMTIETRSQAPSLATVRNDATSAGIVLVLGMLAMTIGLIRSETASELRTLTATGASGRTRRAITAATAGALGLLGGVLGTAVAYLATGAFFRSQLSERMGHPPTLDLILILVGLPVLATAGGWLFGGRQPPVIARQPIE